MGLTEGRRQWAEGRGLVAAILLLCWGCAPSASHVMPQEGPIDWEEEAEEAVGLLQSMIRIEVVSLKFIGKEVNKDVTV